MRQALKCLSSGVLSPALIPALLALSVVEASGLAAAQQAAAPHAVTLPSSPDTHPPAPATAGSQPRTSVALQTPTSYLSPLFVTLPDGHKVPVTRPPSEAELQSLRPPTPPFPSSPEPAPPASVDLTADQTPVKDQGNRDTCGTFGTTAALEAAYKRAFHVTLDLSEQYLNHWGQIMVSAGSGTPLPASENNAGAIGGGGLNRPLAVLQRGVGAPTEDQLRYRADAGYQNPDPGDQPDIMNWALPHSQREIDDFNLAATPGSYVFDPPTVETTAIMPQAAIEGAHYRITSAHIMSTDQLHDLNAYRRILAEHHEIIMEFHCCDGIPGFNSTAAWTLPPGSTGGNAGHVVLLVGYDDARQMFRIKNSYGPNWADHGYAWMSYQFVTGQPVYNAAWIDGVVAVPQPTQADVWSEKQLWLGRWNFDFDGWKGLLDVDNLTTADETVRLGTLFLNDGRIFRVNGTQKGNLLTASVDWNQPNLPSTQLGSTRFSLYLFSWDHQSFAGFQDESGNTYAVEGLKSGTVTGGAAPGPLNQGSWFGIWDATIDGRRGVLDVTAVHWATGALTATYTPNGGTALGVHATVSSDPRVMTMTIDFPTPQSFTARLNGHEWGVMSGTTVWNNLTFGWMATRRVGAGQPPPTPPTQCQQGCATARDQCMAMVGRDGTTPRMCATQYQACMNGCNGL